MEIGPHGDFAPVALNGLRYETYVAILGRLRTYRGFQIMRPNYGSRVHRVIDRRDLNILYRAVQEALEGIPNFNRFTVAIDKNNRDVVILIRDMYSSEGEFITPTAPPGIFLRISEDGVLRVGENAILKVGEI